MSTFFCLGIEPFLKKMESEGGHPIIGREEPTRNESESYFVVKFLDDNTTITGKTIIESYARAIDKLVNDCGLEQVIQADKDYVDKKAYRKLRPIPSPKNS